MTHQHQSEPTPPVIYRAVSWPGRLVVGATYPFRAFRVLFATPSLWQYVLIPLLINLILGATLYVSLLSAGRALIDSWIAALPVWAAFLETVLTAVLVVLLLIVIGFVFLRFGVLLGSPWYSQLSEQLERQRIGYQPPAEPLTFTGITRDLWLSLLFEVKKLMLIALVAPFLLLLQWFPPIGTAVAASGWFTLGATVVCLDFFDFSLARRRLRFRAKLAYIRRSLPTSAGFGLVCLGLVSIPFLNLLAIPLCATAGTLFFCDRLYPLLQTDQTAQERAAAEP